MQRVTIQEARKLFDMGVVIYLLPSHTEYVPGIEINVFTSNLKDKDFDSFVKGYKAVSSNKMRYYVEEKEVEEKEVEAAKLAYKKINELKGEKVVKKSSTQAKGLNYSNQELMRIGSNVASIWGAECYNYEINKKSRIVTFFCIEHGEEFVTEREFNKLKDYM